MTEQEMIEVLQAHIDGKTIEIKAGDIGWLEIKYPDWNFGRSTYRVKPVPREFWINVYDGHPLAMYVHRTKESADKENSERKECIHVIEVTE